MALKELLGSRPSGYEISGLNSSAGETREFLSDIYVTEFDSRLVTRVAGSRRFYRKWFVGDFRRAKAYSVETITFAR